VGARSADEGEAQWQAALPSIIGKWFIKVMMSGEKMKGRATP